MISRSTLPMSPITSSSGKENEPCKLLSYKGKVFSVEIPNFIELEVTQTEPGVKGNTLPTP